MTTRRWMVAVAFLGVVLAVRAEMARWAELSTRYENLADMYSENPYTQYLDWSDERWLARCREIDAENKTGRHMLGLTLLYPPTPPVARKMHAHYERLRIKYERAARYPWLPVAPDPQPAIPVPLPQ